MDQHAERQRKSSTSRQEKLSILSAILGPETLAKLKAEHPAEASAPSTAATEPDPTRAEWHRNRLLERFRTNFSDQIAPEHVGNAAPEPVAVSPKPAQVDKPLGIEDRLNQVGTPQDLAMEHPAVIAHILCKMPRGERVHAMKALPGPVARAVLRRLR